MKAIHGLLWALGGGVAGCLVGILVAMAILAVGNFSNREGAHGYFAMALGLIGAALGLAAGLILYARSAPAGANALAYFGSGAVGLCGVAVALGLGIWAFVYFQERPVAYADRAMADLLLELRAETARVPAGAADNWFSVEVHTSSTRPVGLVLWDKARIDGRYSVFPVVQGPLYRAGSRVVVVDVAGKQVEAFVPAMKRVPDPNADWSEWCKPQRVDPPFGVVPAAPLDALFELRYRVRRYGD
jgi:hypothetical protein